MKDRTRKIIAWIGLAFAAIFTVSLILYLFSPDMWGGKVGYVALASFIVTVVFWCLIYFDNKERMEREAAELEKAERKAENKRKRAENNKKQENPTREETTSGQAENNSDDNPV